MKTLINTLIIIITLSFFYSCSDNNDYIDKYADGKEIRYAGKSDSIVIFPGRDRLQIQWLLGVDVNLSKTVIYWSSKSDSLVVNFDRNKLESDTLKRVINNLKEGSYSFELINYDIYGNKSMPSSIVGLTYGDVYEKRLYTRNLTGFTAVNLDGDFKMEFADSTANSVATEIQFMTNANEKKTIYLSNTEHEVLLPKYNTQVPIQYRTLYKPIAIAIDTFYTAFENLDVSDKEFTFLIPKPYAKLELTGDSPVESAASWTNLWDDRVQTTWKGYGAIGYSNFSTWKDVGSDVWVTIDVNRPVKLSRMRGDFYYYKEPIARCAKILGLYAYKGDGVPPSMPDGDVEYWKDWELIYTFDTTNYPYDVNNIPLTQEGFSRGLDGSMMKEDVPAARYYRLKCTESWHTLTGSKNFSLSEITFWAHVN